MIINEIYRIRHGLLVASSVTALALGGCGGGGGGEDLPAPSASTPKINSTNSSTVAGRSFSVADALYSSGSVATSQVKSADDPSVSSVRLNLAEFATRRLLDLETGSASGGTPTTKAIESATEPCPLGGSASATVNDADNSGSLTPGDTGTFTFYNCVVEGATLNGAFSFSNLSLTGSDSTPSRSVGATFNFNNLRATSGAESASVNGDFSVQAAITNFAPYVLDISITGTRLALAENNWTGTLAGFSARVSVNETAGTYLYAVSGTMSGTDLPDTITLATPITVTGIIGTYPAAGVMTARASDGTSARLTVNSPTSVTVDVDGNADGTFESSQTMTWAQLVAA